MATAKKNPRLDSDLKLLAGLQKHQAQLPSFVIAGKTYTPTDCVNAVQARVTIEQAVVTDKATWQKSVAASHDEFAQSRSFIRDLKQALVLAYSSAPDTLSDYGLAPRKKAAPKTAAGLVVAAAKRKATREARNTMGSKERKKIKGTVPETLSVSTPQAELVPSPAEPTVSIGPAVSAPTGATPPSPSSGAASTPNAPSAPKA